MRGIDERPVEFFSYVDIERRAPPDHPLRLIRALVDEVLHACRGFSPSSTPGIEGREFRLSGFCALCFCKPSIACDPSGC